MDKELAIRAAEVLKAVAHPIRLQVVEVLKDGERCVSDIAEALDEKQAIISQQLNVMKHGGILDSRREGAKIFYRLENKNVVRLLSCVFDHCQAEERG